MTRLFLSLWCAIFAFCPLMQAGLPSGDGWKLHCHDFNAAYTGAPVANGTIGILPWKEPFSVKHLILNHIFEYSEKKGVNRVIAGINPMGMTMMVDDQQVTSSNIAKWNQEIDMRHARHNSQFLACGKVDVRYTIVALRNMPYAAMMRITVKAPRCLCGIDQHDEHPFRRLSRRQQMHRLQIAHRKWLQTSLEGLCRNFAWPL